MAETEARSPAGSRPLRTAAVVAFLLALLAAAAAVSVYLWRELQGTVIGTHGVIAMTLGVAFTLLIGGGLVYLVIVSDRRGFDEGAGKD